MKVIPIYASAGIHGFASPAADYSQLSLSLDELLIDDPAATFLGQAMGDSMNNVGIFDGDILVVNRAAKVSHNSVIVGNFNGEFVVKIMDIHRRLLLSANEAVQPVSINEWDTFSIEGVVTRSVRCFTPCHLLRNAGQ